MYEVGVYTKPLNAEAMTNIMVSASWRRPGPTFLERFLVNTCADKTEAERRDACGPAAEQLLSDTLACQQGDACRCMSSLMPVHRETLLCQIPCPGTSAGMKRTLLGVLEEKCGDEAYHSRSCENDYDCFIIHPSEDGFMETGKYQCEATSGKCVLKKFYKEHFHTGMMKFCLAYAAKYYEKGLDNYTALMMIAGL